MNLVDNLKIICVLGAHRSGTSVITRGIVALGADPGERLMPHHIDNPAGFWEDLDIYELNESILSKFYFGWEFIDHPWIDRFSNFLSLYEHDYFDRATNILKNRFKLSNTIVIKDPRINILLPFWKKVFSSFSCDVNFVFTFRNPLESSESLLKRNEIGIDDGLNIWLYSNFQALRHINSDMIAVSFDTFLNNPERELIRISEFISLKLTNQEYLKFRNSFLDQKLRHHHNSKSDLLAIQKGREIIKALYSQMEDWSSKSFTSNQDIKKFLTSNQVKIASTIEKPTPPNQAKYKVKLLVDGGKGFVDDLNLVKQATKKSGSFRFDLSSYNQIEVLRLELGSRPCFIKIKLFITGKTGKNKLYPITTGNYNYKHNNSYVFDSRNPYLLIPFTDEEPSSVYFDYTIVHSSEHLFSILLYMSKQDLDSNKTKLQENKLKIKQYVDDAINKDEQFKEMLNQSKEKDLLLVQKDLQFVTLLEQHKEKNDLLESRANQVIEALNNNKEKDLLLHQKDIRIKELLAQIKGNKQLLGQRDHQINELVEQRNRKDQQLTRNELQIERVLEKSTAKDLTTNERFTKLDTTLEKILVEGRAIKESQSDTWNKPIARRQDNNRGTIFLTLLHTLKDSIRFLRHPKESLRLFQATKILRHTDLFDDVYYLKHNRDLLSSNCDLLEHYLIIGWKEGRDPSSSFSTNFYLKHNEDVKKTEINPLYHYAKYGQFEGRVKNLKEFYTLQEGSFDHPEYFQALDIEKYLEANKDVAKAIEQGEYKNAKEHLQLFGLNEIQMGTRRLQLSTPLYDENRYLELFEDIRSAVDIGDFESGFQHFMLYGHRELLKKTRFWPDFSQAMKHMDLIDHEDTPAFENSALAIPEFDHPIVTIIIPAYNQAKFTLACVKSIIEHTVDIPYKIIIMDDNSPDPEAKQLGRKIKNVTFISNDHNMGFLRNCNKGAAHAQTNYILFLNNDTNVQPDWLKPLVDLIESNHNIGMVGSKLVYPDGRLQEAGGIIWQDGRGWNFGRLDNPDYPEYCYVKEVDYISGASIMIRKSLWETIGGFDDRYAPAYAEDSDLAFEVRKHGYKVMLQPKSVVVHYEGISHGVDENSGIKNYQVKNQAKFLEKWKEVLTSDHLENGKDVFWARDRSKGKTSVLVIDHYVPHHDKDAGSKTTFMYLNIMIELGFNVKFLGDNFYRHEPYTTDLELLGIEVLNGIFYKNNWQEWLSENQDYFDVIFLNRPHISEKYIEFFKKQDMKSKLIYYGHDLHFLRTKRQGEIEKNQALIKESEEWKRREINIFDHVDLIYYPSDIEVQEIKKINSQYDVRQISPFAFNTKKLTNDFDQRKDLLFVGGFNHSPNVDAIIWFIEKIFPNILERMPDVRLHIVGSCTPESIKNTESKHIVIHGFVSEERLKQLYSEVRISIAPLRYGAGIKGKIIESISYGVPVITTDIGAEGLKNTDKFLMVANNELEFSQLLCDSYGDTKKLSELRQGAYETIKEFFSVNAIKKRIEHDFNSHVQ